MGNEYVGCFKWNKPTLRVNYEAGFEMDSQLSGQQVQGLQRVYDRMATDVLLLYMTASQLSQISLQLQSSKAWYVKDSYFHVCVVCIPELAYFVLVQILLSVVCQHGAKDILQMKK